MPGIKCSLNLASLIEEVTTFLYPGSQIVSELETPNSASKISEESVFL
jgi:hypothetical protein